MVGWVRIALGGIFCSATVTLFFLVFSCAPRRRDVCMYVLCGGPDEKEEVGRRRADGVLRLTCYGIILRFHVFVGSTLGLSLIIVASL